MRMYKIICIIAIILGTCTLTEAASIPVDLSYELPVNPQGKKTKKKKNTRKRLWAGGDHQPPTKIRRWATLSAVIGGYLIVFSILNVLFLIGFNAAWYVFFLFAFPIVPALMMLISGIQLIDRSYIYYSEHHSLKKERLRPLIWRDFIFAFMLILLMIPMLWVGFYITTILVLLATVILLITAFMKVGTYKNL